jgi:glycosyltransferase involved in cell wall biosynthesis
MSLRVLVMASVRWWNACAEYAVEIARGLAERGHDTTLLVLPGSPVEAEARRRGVRVLASLDLTSTAPGALVGNLRALRGVLRDLDPHVVNAHRSEDHLLGALAARGTGIPVVRTRGDVRPPRRHLANRALYRRATAAHIAAADFMPARFYAPLGVDPARVHVIRPGLDPARFTEGAPTREEARRRLGMDADAPWVGQVGRLTRGKGPQVLLAAAARLPRPVRVLLSGEDFPGAADGFTHDALRALAAEHGTGDRVRILGRVPDVRVPLRALDVLAVPSLGSEAISRIAMEALALGVPVVASAVNALPEVVGGAGRVVTPGDPAALAEGLASLLADPEALRRAGAAGPERIRRRYDRGVQLDRTLEVMLALRGAGSPARAAPPR